MDLKYYLSIILRSLFFIDNARIKIIAENISFETFLPNTDDSLLSSLTRKYFRKKQFPQAIVSINHENYLGTFKINPLGQITIILPTKIDGNIENLGIDLYC